MRKLRRAVLGVLLAATTAALPNAAHAAVPGGCTLSSALFPSPYQRAENGTDYRIAALQVYQQGVWSGYMADGTSRFQLITWRRGHGVHTVAWRRITGAPFQLNYSVKAVGVTASGAVVANMQDDHTTIVRPYAYVGGHHFLLRSAPTWRAATALAVTDDGRILGYGTIGRGEHAHFQFAVWRGIHARPLLRRTVDPNTLPVADQSGDFAWDIFNSKTLETTFHVRTSSGQVRTLDFGNQYGGGIESAAGHYVFASIDHGVMRFDAAAAGSGPIRGQVVARSRNQIAVLASGRTGEFVDDSFRFHLSHPSRTVPVPDAYVGDLALPGAAVGVDHRVAFTSRRDHLVHLLTCS